MLVDLHLHTTRSDGIWQPERLFEEIRVRGLEAFCVSDHDNLDAYPVPADLQDRSICGLEVDSHFAGHTAHILAYGVSDDRSPLLQTLRLQRDARNERMQAMVDRLNAMGVAVTMDDVRRESRAASSIGRPHLARALVASGVVATIQEAFDKFIADEGQGYVALARQTADATIRLIHESGGVAVVAHPKRLRDPGHLVQLCELGADGVEIVHPTADYAYQAELQAFARARNLLVTAGTDFHVPTERPLGVEFEERAINDLRAAISAAA